MNSIAKRPAVLRTIAGVASFVAISAFVVQSSQAAFTATATNQDNAFEVATIGLGSSLTIPIFHHTLAADAATSGMAPGESRDGCLVLSYSGDTDSVAAVTLAAAAASGDTAGIADQFTVAYEVDTADNTCAGSFAAADDSWTVDGAYAATATTWTPSTTDTQASVYFRATLNSALSSDQGATVDDVDVTFSVTTTP